MQKIRKKYDQTCTRKRDGNFQKLGILDPVVNNKIEEIYSYLQYKI
jgi:hypothetical protein